jgi:anti-sigma regulatory factor (Ser/Thr protein kinase)
LPGSRETPDGRSGSFRPSASTRRPGRSDSLSHVLSMPAVPRAVGEARRWVRDTLARWELDELAESAVEITSELATNAIMHAKGGSSVVVLLMFAAGTLRLEVRDRDPANLPKPWNPTPADVDGRGLMIVDALSGRWGVRVTSTGKSVWSELDIANPVSTACGDRTSTREAWS